MKLPIKTRILEMAIEKNGPFTSRELSEVLKKEYNNEKTTTVENIDKQIQAYCRVGFINDDEVRLGQDNEPEVLYRITETGKNSLKYIPGHGNKWF